MVTAEFRVGTTTETSGGTSGADTISPGLVSFRGVLTGVPAAAQADHAGRRDDREDRIDGLAHERLAVGHERDDADRDRRAEQGREDTCSLGPEPPVSERRCGDEDQEACPCEEPPPRREPS